MHNSMRCEQYFDVHVHPILSTYAIFVFREKWGNVNHKLISVCRGVYIAIVIIVMY